VFPPVPQSRQTEEMTLDDNLVVCENEHCHIVRLLELEWVIFG